ncbi:MAG: hypothetical protein ABSF47_00310 [Minisyncoccia bacterium]|jgi:plastocyanin
MPKKYAISAIVIVVLALGFILLSRSEKNTGLTPPLNPPLDSNPVTVNTVPRGTNQDSSPIINFNDNGFSPNVLTVQKGATVIFKNSSSFDFWPASGVHPTHAVYSGTTLQEHCPDNAGVAFDACGGIPPGSSWSFKFEKIGSWDYHDHLHAQLTGKIIVQ